MNYEASSSLQCVRRAVDHEDCEALLHPVRDLLVPLFIYELLRAVSTLFTCAFCFCLLKVKRPVCLGLNAPKLKATGGFWLTCPDCCGPGAWVHYVILLFSLFMVFNVLLTSD